MSELRWHPLRQEWVITATHRQDRTYKPPVDYCPLCPTRPGGTPTEIPAPDYDIVVFENRFPSFSLPPPDAAVEGNVLHPVAPANGVCEVVCYSAHHERTLTDEPVDQIEKLVRVWRDRFAALGARPEIEYVFIFENKGDAIGVTLSHPHGQIYAFPYVPPVVARELEACGRHYDRTGRCLLCDLLADEEADGRRVVCGNNWFVAVVPFYARYPYEVHVSPRRHVQALTDFLPEEERGLAEVLKDLLVRYDRLFGFRLPYMMVMHQRPTDGGAYPHYHFHIEFYPPNRTATRLKYLAGCESGAGSFINDTLPEETAKELRTSGDRAIR